MPYSWALAFQFAPRLTSNWTELIWYYLAMKIWLSSNLITEFSFCSFHFLLNFNFFLYQRLSLWCHEPKLVCLRSTMDSPSDGNSSKFSKFFFRIFSINLNNTWNVSSSKQDANVSNGKKSTPDKDSVERKKRSRSREKDRENGSARKSSR